MIRATRHRNDLLRLNEERHGNRFGRDSCRTRRRRTHGRLEQADIARRRSCREAEVDGESLPPSRRGMSKCAARSQLQCADLKAQIATDRIIAPVERGPVEISTAREVLHVRGESRAPTGDGFRRDGLGALRPSHREIPSTRSHSASAIHADRASACERRRQLEKGDGRREEHDVADQLSNMRSSERRQNFGALHMRGARATNTTRAASPPFATRMLFRPAPANVALIANQRWRAYGFR